MVDSIIPHEYNSTLIGQRPGDGYINLTAMAQANGKLVADYLRLDSTKAFLEELSGSMGIPIDLIIDKKMTGPNSGRGTWGHPQVAIHCGQWCSPAFAVLVTQWVMTWMTTGRNPLADMDRVGLRSSLKDDSRLRMTDQVKAHLEQIRRYDDKYYRSIYFSRVHDAINLAVTGETAKQMRDRLSAILGRKVSDSDLIRDYFPATVLSSYISMCETSANLMFKQNLNPLDAVHQASELVLPFGYIPSQIDFVEHIKFVRSRLTAAQAGQLGLPD